MTVVYVSNADSREISVLRLDATGDLTPVAAVPADGTVMPLAVSPDRRYLYAGLRSEPFSVKAFGIEPTNGGLIGLRSTVLPDNMAYLSTDRTGRYLFGASYSGDLISVQPIAANGAVRPRPDEVIATAPHAHSIVIDPANRHVFVAVSGGDHILQYRFDATAGRLTPNRPAAVATPLGAGPRHLVFHPSGRVVLACHELDGTVQSHLFDPPTGTLTPAASRSALPQGFSGNPWVSELRVTPDGRYLYVAERTSDTLAGFHVDGDTGALEPIGHTRTEAQPRGFAIDPGGRFLVAAGQKSHAVTSYAIDPATGALAAVHRRSVGRNPNWVEIIDLPGA
ncbi:lactonase family protein [Nocardia brasiliensis]|uniref:lactonase family protein n=1 Tax=Nocardia brasiliensis TaxID=37326 RepID=UPI0018949394|nr:beta-propeller fold lactonase family protein [Nocardia brasiliensis]MBF6548275.1 beta-propeller fold lactonase family protein [Nocardia brasiliensis]